MIIDAKTVALTLVVVGVATYLGLGAIRSYALSIAQENHDANLAMEMSEEARRARRERDADAAATAAFAKVEPLLPASVVASTQKAAATEPPPSGGNSLDVAAVVENDNEVDDENTDDGEKIATI